MDMPAAKPEEVKDQIIELIGGKREDIIEASGKTGLGVERILDTIIEKVPAPEGDPEAPLQALIFDSVFNPFRGIIAYFRIYNGTLKTNDRVKFVNTKKEYNADEVGILEMDLCPRPVISAGNVGYIISGIKQATEVKVGDTITHVENPCTKAIEGFAEVKPMVYAGVYPPTNTKSCAHRSKNCNSTTHRSPLPPNHRLRSDLVSAADFWECCTWILCRSVFRANLIWT